MRSAHPYRPVVRYDVFPIPAQGRVIGSEGRSGFVDFHYAALEETA